MKTPPEDADIDLDIDSGGDSGSALTPLTPDPPDLIELARAFGGKSENRPQIIFWIRRRACCHHSCPKCQPFLSLNNTFPTHLATPVAGNELESLRAEVKALRAENSRLRRLKNVVCSTSFHPPAALDVMCCAYSFC